jgi:hypothetical protein
MWVDSQVGRLLLLHCRSGCIGYWGLGYRLLDLKRILPLELLVRRGGRELRWLFVACRYFLGLVVMEVEERELRGV